MALSYVWGSSPTIKLVEASKTCLQKPKSLCEYPRSPKQILRTREKQRMWLRLWSFFMLLRGENHQHDPHELLLQPEHFDFRFGLLPGNPPLLPNSRPLASAMTNQCPLIILRPAQNEASETLPEPADYITLIDGEL